jgi:pyruvate dehydrogenase E2 component (dihydrolipoamide acetyltransferase)
VSARGRPEIVELTKLQQSVARRIAESKATVPHLQLEAAIEMGRALAERARIRDAGGGEATPSVNDMVLSACALALREHPRLNAAYRDGRIEVYPRVNVGFAVAAQEAFLVPTVFDADRKPLSQIAAETRTLIARARDGSITPPELAGATFTVSNLGTHGIASFEAVIDPSQAAILAVGSIEQTPAVRDGEITTAETMLVTLACDHRILHGPDAAEFLGRVRGLLEEPGSLAS